MIAGPHNVEYIPEQYSSHQWRVAIKLKERHQTAAAAAAAAAATPPGYSHLRKDKRLIFNLFNSLCRKLKGTWNALCRQSEPQQREGEFGLHRSPGAASQLPAPGPRGLSAEPHRLGSERHAPSNSSGNSGNGSNDSNIGSSGDKSSYQKHW